MCLHIHLKVNYYNISFPSEALIFQSLMYAIIIMTLQSGEK